jgi:hypothetical protein
MTWTLPSGRSDHILQKGGKKGIELSLERDNIRGNIGGFEMGPDFTWLLVSSAMT